MFKKLHHIIIAALLLGLLLQCGCGAGDAALTVLFTNDVHGMLLPHESYTEPDAAALTMDGTGPPALGAQNLGH